MPQDEDFEQASGDEDEATTESAVPTDEVPPSTPDVRGDRVSRLKQELFGEMLTAAEVAAILDVHPRTVGQYIREGRLRGIPLGGGWRVSEQALREFVAALSIAGPPREDVPGGTGIFSRFTKGARQIVVACQAEARLLGHNYIGTEHLLLGILSLTDTASVRALESLDVSPSEARDKVMAIIGSGTPGEATGYLPFTARAKKVLELSLREALQHGDKHIGDEHITLALIREGQGVAAQVLEKLGVSYEALCEALGMG